GNYIVVGVSSETTSYDIEVVKFDASLNILWRHNYNYATKYDAANDVKTDEDENIYVAGFITNSLNERQAITIKYSPSGSLMWTHLEDSGGKNNSENLKITVQPDGLIFVAGQTDGPVDR